MKRIAYLIIITRRGERLPKRTQGTSSLRKKRLLIVLGTRAFIRDYLRADVISELRRDWDLSFAVPEKLSFDPELFGGAHIHRFAHSADQEAEFDSLHRWSVLASRRCSTSFGFRAERLFPSYRTSFLRGIGDARLLVERVRATLLKEKSLPLLPRFQKTVRRLAGLGLPRCFRTVGPLKMGVLLKERTACPPHVDVSPKSSKTSCAVR